MSEGPVPLLEARNISKRYGSVAALRGANLTLNPGEVLGLVGDNGAGKSTLVNILSGSLTPNGGEILIDGKRVELKNPIDARTCGIETVYQDLALAPDLTIWANIFAGRERLKSGPLRWVGWLDRRGMEAESAKDLARTRIQVPSVNAHVGKLSGGQRQAVAVARAVAWGSRVLILDEPTAALGVEQQARVTEVVRSVAEHGVAVILVTHNLPQVRELCSRTAVMFQGQVIADLKMKDVDLAEVVSWITGVGVHAANEAKAALGDPEP